MSKVAVIGGGYVGITTAACLSHLGHDVRCAVDDDERAGRLRKAEIPVLERDLPGLVKVGIETHRLDFVADAAEAVAGAGFVFLCLPASGAAEGSAGRTSLEFALREFSDHLVDGAVVITKSTTPVGTTRKLARLVEECGGGGRGVRVVCNPEFLREGSAVHDFLHPDRIVIGCDHPDLAVRITELYRGVQAPTVVTDPASAELIKFASSAYLATRVSFINAVAGVCEATGADVKDVALGMGYDRRIGSAYLEPGPGFGGSCLPEDAAALLQAAEALGTTFEPVEAALAVNDRQRASIIAKLERSTTGPWELTRVALWGLTFKANADDLRDSPALEVAATLHELGARVVAYDPVAGERAQRLLPWLDVATDPYEATEEADVLVVMTEWDEFRWVDFDRVRALMAGTAIVDARNLLEPSALRRRGFTYTGVGR